MADDETPKPAPSLPPRAKPPGALTLGLLGALGLGGFAVAYALILERTSPASVPQAVVAQTPAATQPPAVARIVSEPGVPGVPGLPGPRGERGPAGPTGDSGIRVVREDCASTNCTLHCGDDELILTAHCGVGRLPPVYPTQHTALCRSITGARIEVVVACLKASR